MPTYEYQCTKCERVFEVFHSIKAKPLRTVETDCCKCQNKAPVRRLIGTGGGVIFKGSGFYETDYRSESYKAGQKAEKDAASAASSSGDGKKSDTGKSTAKKKESTSVEGTSKKKSA